MIESPPTAIEALDSAGSGVRVEFHWSGDRYAHTIFAVAGDHAVPLLASVEGGPDDLFPPSPSYSELHRQADTLYLGGATSAAYWSMSVEANEAELVFDVACRLKTAAPSLSSLYRPFNETTIEQVVEAVVVSLPDTSCKVTISTSASTDDPNCLATRQEALDAYAELQISSNQATPNRFPATIQWRYAVSRRSND